MKNAMLIYGLGGPVNHFSLQFRAMLGQAETLVQRLQNEVRQPHTVEYTEAS